ncbi:hypothetical protein FB384_004182 [Prauserella sediminis]|uniref:NUDIX hydrolase n=1 Tax=Prauserella sediminis TaxID=577680 RepID=A0A839XT79_9PSEU|nr:hypothetical protein [Prauserella sediminis]MBB3665229.1 hypothetical protein [Prauserella sediminis]
MNTTGYRRPSDGQRRIRAHLLIHANDDTSGEANIAVIRSPGGNWVLPGGPVVAIPAKRSLLEHVRNQTGLEVAESALTWVGVFEAADDPACLVLVWETGVEHTALATHEDCQWADHGGLPRPTRDVAVFDTDDSSTHDIAHLIPLHHP